MSATNDFNFALEEEENNYFTDFDENGMSTDEELQLNDALLEDFEPDDEDSSLADIIL